MHQRSRDSSRLHVLFVNTRSGIGADVAVHLSLARHLGTAGVAVTFATNGAAPDLAMLRAELPGSSAVRLLPCHLGMPLSGRHGFGRASAALGNTAALTTFGRLAARIQMSRIDVLHTTDRPRDALFTVLLGRATGRPTLIHMHSNWGPGIGRMTRWAFTQCGYVLGVSEYTRRSLELAGIPAERLAMVHNAVDADHFNPDLAPRGAARARWSIPPDAPLIGLVGRFMRYKGHEDLLRAVARGQGSLAKAHVLLVGAEGPDTDHYTAALRTCAADLGISGRIHFTGLQADVRPIYADLDVLAVPSWEEPFGLVVVEAMAMRVPVVAYRSGGIPEIVRDGADGVLTAPRSVTALAGALERVLDDPAFRARLGASGRAHVRAAFGPDRQARHVAALYRRLINHERIPASVPSLYG